MPRIVLQEGTSIHCAIDDYLWPWDDRTPVLMMHGFARNALFWNRWVPASAETHRIYRPDLLGCGLSDQPRPEYHYTPDTIGAQIVGVLDALSLSRVHWIGESSGGLIGLLLAPSRLPSFSQHPESIGKHGELGEHGSEALDQGRQPRLRHIGDQIVEHAALPKQRVSPSLGSV